MLKLVKIVKTHSLVWTGYTFQYWHIGVVGGWWTVHEQDTG